jgi:hypothetical protein
VRPFDGLRFLAIFGDFDWTAEDTAAVAGLQALEQIELSVGEAFPSERFGVLAALPRLQFVTLQLARDLRATDIDALAKLPVLASLQVRGGRIDPAVVAALARLPRLRELVLADLDRCPEEALCALRYVPLLRRLQLEGMGAIPRTIPSVGDVDKRSVGLSIAVAKALAALPRLRSLTLTNVEVTAAAIDALPASLEQIGILASPQVGADVIASLARFPNLRRLDLDAGDRQASLGRLRFVAEFEEAIAKAYADAPPRDEVWHAQAELLRKVAPRELRWIGEMPAEIREAVAALPLTAIAFTRPRRTELELVRSLPGLRQVTLDSCELRRSDVELLAAVPNLLELHLRFVQTAIDEVREMLPKVRITTHGF